MYMWPNRQNPAAINASAFTSGLGQTAAGYGQNGRLAAAMSSNPYTSMVYPGYTERSSVPPRPPEYSNMPSSQKMVQNSQISNFYSPNSTYVDLYRQGTADSLLRNSAYIPNKDQMPGTTYPPRQLDGFFAGFPNVDATHATLISGLSSSDYSLVMNSSTPVSSARSNFTEGNFHSSLNGLPSKPVHESSLLPTDISQPASQQQMSPVPARRNSHSGTDKQHIMRSTSESYAPNSVPPQTDSLNSPRQPLAYPSPVDVTPLTPQAPTPKTPRVISLSEELRQLALKLENSHSTTSPASVGTARDKEVINAIEKLKRLIPSHIFQPERASVTVQTQPEEEIFIVDPFVREFCLSVPRELVLKASSSPSGGIRLGIWAREEIPAATEFGPFSGRLLDSSCGVPGYLDDHWLMKSLRTSNAYYFITDKQNPLPKWMPFINPGNMEEKGCEPNCILFARDNEFIIRITCSVEAHKEMLISVNENLVGLTPKMLNINTSLPDTRKAISSKNHLKKNLLLKESEIEDECMEESTIANDQGETEDEYETMSSVTASSASPMKSSSKRSKKKRKNSHKKSHRRSRSATEVPFFIRSLACVPCKRYFAEVSAFEVHRNSYHKDSTPWICKVCPSAKFKELSKLKQHIDKHSESERLEYLYLCRQEAFELQKFDVDFDQDLSVFKDYELFSGLSTILVKNKKKRKHSSHVETDQDQNVDSNEEEEYCPPSNKVCRYDEKEENEIEEEQQFNDQTTDSSPKKSKHKNSLKKSKKKRNELKKSKKKKDKKRKRAELSKEMLSDNDNKHFKSYTDDIKLKKKKKKHGKKGKSKHSNKEISKGHDSNIEECDKKDETIVYSPPPSSKVPSFYGGGSGFVAETQDIIQAAIGSASLQNDSSGDTNSVQNNAYEETEYHVPQQVVQPFVANSIENSNSKINKFSPLRQKVEMPASPDIDLSDVRDKINEHPILIKTLDNQPDYRQFLINRIPSPVSKKKERRKFACSICGLKIIMVSAFERHMNEKHNIDKPWSCEFCEQSFKAYSPYQSHLKTKHVSDPLSPCEDPATPSSVDCNVQNGTTLSSIEDIPAAIVPPQYVNHLPTDEENEVSQIMVNDLPSQQSHWSEETGEYSSGNEEQHYCSTGEKKRKRTRIERHFTCDHCGLTFKQAAKYARHLADIHNIRKPWTCTSCNKAFASHQALENHQNKCNSNSLSNSHCSPGKNFILPHTAPNSGALRCEQCNVEIKSQKQFEKHMNGDHSKALPYICRLCGLSFARQALLTDHIRSAHPNDDMQTVEPDLTSNKVKQQVQCPVCFKYMDKGYLADHSNIHTGDKPYVCDICFQRFAQRAGLAYHKKKAHSSFDDNQDS